MKNIFFAALILLFTASCVETIVVGSVAGAVLVTREKSLLSTKDDVIIATKIDAYLLKEGLKSPKDSVGVMVNEGRVLLTGVIRDLAKGKQAVDESWKIKGVKEVIDEIQINPKGMGVNDFTDSLKDTYITSVLKTKLFFKPDIVPTNYKIATVSGTVYALGTAKNESDMRKALEIISKTRGVKKVVNHIILADDSRRR